YHQALWRFRGAARARPDGAGWRVPGPARPVRLRQDNHAALGGRAGAPDQRRYLYRRYAGERPATGRARHRDGVPVLRAVPAYDDLRQYRLPAAGPENAG